MKIDEVIIKLCAERGYDPSQINDYPTLLEQLECIKSLLETYPNQQYFTLSQYNYNSTTHVYTFDIGDINSYGRQINIGDLLIITNESGVLDFIQITKLDKETNIGEASYVGQLTGATGATGATGLNALEYTGSGITIAQVSLQGNTFVNIPFGNFNRTPVQNDGVLVYFNVTSDTSSQYVANCLVQGVDTIRSTVSLRQTSVMTRIKGDSVDVTVQQLHELIEGSPTVVADINEAGTAINIHLDNTYKTKVDNSLQAPTVAPLSDELVGIGTNKGQKCIAIGNGLIIKNGALTNARTLSEYVVKFEIIPSTDNATNINFYLQIAFDSTPTNFNDLTDYEKLRWLLHGVSPVENGTLYIPISPFTWQTDTGEELISNCGIYVSSNEDADVWFDELNNFTEFLTARGRSFRLNEFSNNPLNFIITECRIF